MVGRNCFCLLAISIFYTLTFAQDLTPELRAEIDRRVNFHRAWDKQMNAPGPKLRGVEMRRQKSRDGIVVAYEFQTEGMRSGIGYDLMTMPTMASRFEDLQSFGEVLVDEKNGRVTDGPNDPRTMILPHPAPGEPFRFALFSKNGTYKVFVTLLPNPVEGSDNGCKVSVVRLMRSFELAFIQLSGFPPETDVAMHGNSEGEVHDHKMKTNADGYSDSAVLPFKLGKSKGKIDLQFTASKCAPKVSFKWGTNGDGSPYQ
jgi:hypothetical protein